MTNTNRDKFTQELLEQVYAGQKKRRDEKHEAVMSAHPWIAQARVIQKKLNESENN